MARSTQRPSFVLQVTPSLQESGPDAETSCYPRARLMYVRVRTDLVRFFPLAYHTAKVYAMAGVNAGKNGICGTGQFRAFTTHQDGEFFPHVFSDFIFSQLAVN